MGWVGSYNRHGAAARINNPNNAILRDLASFWGPCLQPGIRCANTSHSRQRALPYGPSPSASPGAAGICSSSSGSAVCTVFRTTSRLIREGGFRSYRPSFREHFSADLRRRVGWGVSKSTRTPSSVSSSPCKPPKSNSVAPGSASTSKSRALPSRSVPCSTEPKTQGFAARKRLAASLHVKHNGRSHGDSFISKPVEMLSDRAWRFKLSLVGRT